jgi:hypothetical protein
MQQMGVWSVMAEHVQIKQAVLTHKLLDKLLDCFINNSAG